MSNIKIVRLTSGEEIICTFTQNKNSSTFKDAAVLIPSPEGKLLLARWMPYAIHPEGGIEIPNAQIVFAIDPQKDLAEHYTNVVVNNLVIPAKKLVNPLEDSGLKLSV
jgi:hypothetical protein